MNSRRLNPLALARAKHLLRCPDCDSIVVLGQPGERDRVEHDDTCPTLAARQREGALRTYVILPTLEVN
jgi:hypothetical protein